MWKNTAREEGGGRREAAVARLAYSLTLHSPFPFPRSPPYFLITRHVRETKVSKADVQGIWGG